MVVEGRYAAQLGSAGAVTLGALTDAESVGRETVLAAEGVDVIQRMAERMTAHDLDGMVALVHADYESEQPFHPARGFGGRAQMKANWGALLTGIPDLRAEVLASVQDGDVVWSEWHWAGTTEQGEPFELRGITQFTVQEGLIVRGRLFTEPVERGGADINDSVEASSGHRPRLEE
jgi:ketosteroid isomerase-like protein